MAINFEAANMAGYNNPRFTVLKAEAEALGALISYPSYEEVTGLIASGVIPLLAVRTPGGTDPAVEHILALAALYDNGPIAFSSPVATVVYDPEGGAPAISFN